MSHKLLSTLILAAGATLVLATAGLAQPYHPMAARHGAAALALKPLSVKLPQSDRSFSGPDAAAINGNCLGCHSADMVLNQPDMPKAAWAAEVAKMMNAFKAPVNKADVPAIVDYLARVKGVK